MKRFEKLIVLSLLIFALTACTPADTSPQASLGKADAPVLIEEFSDFECPACGVVSPELEEVVRKNLDFVQFKYYHFPLPQHTRAFPAAEASECANEQGKFWEYSSILFKNQKNLGDDSLKQFAAKLNLDTEAFNTCFDSQVKKNKVKANLYEGRRRQVSFTPSIYVNGELVKWSGAETFEAYLNGLR
ncbi:thioredoxin domain-containing protein [Candidatus Pacearchaeota archaeon]|nr:thioredoxin domain-containing protein [Candidatus Pacearchaeota archaeon]